jgi:hypothetical protein
MSKRILKSFLFAMLFLLSSLNYGCDSSSSSRQTTPTPEQSLNEKIYQLNYTYAHNGGIEAAKEDKEKNLPYEPEVVLAQPAFQAVIKMYSNKVVEKYGETYRQDAERGFRDGFMAGYKEGYK